MSGFPSQRPYTHRGQRPWHRNRELHIRFVTGLDDNFGRVEGDAFALGQFDFQRHVLLERLAPLQCDGNALGFTLFDLRVEGWDINLESFALANTAAFRAVRCLLETAARTSVSTIVIAITFFIFYSFLKLN